MYHRVQLTRVRALKAHGICIPGGAFEVRCDQDTGMYVCMYECMYVTLVHGICIASVSYLILRTELMGMMAATAMQ